MNGSLSRLSQAALLSAAGLTAGCQYDAGVILRYTGYPLNFTPTTIPDTTASCSTPTASTYSLDVTTNVTHHLLLSSARPFNPQGYDILATPGPCPLPSYRATPSTIYFALRAHVPSSELGVDGEVIMNPLLTSGTYCLAAIPTYPCATDGYSAENLGHLVEMTIPQHQE